MKIKYIIIAAFLSNISSNIFSSESFDELAQTLKNAGFSKIARSLENFTDALENFNEKYEEFLKTWNEGPIFYLSREEIRETQKVKNDVEKTTKKVLDNVKFLINGSPEQEQEIQRGTKAISEASQLISITPRVQQQHNDWLESSKTRTRYDFDDSDAGDDDPSSNAYFN